MQRFKELCLGLVISALRPKFSRSCRLRVATRRFSCRLYLTRNLRLSAWRYVQQHGDQFRRGTSSSQLLVSSMVALWKKLSEGRALRPFDVSKH